jgi:hypothetical protein
MSAFHVKMIVQLQALQVLMLLVGTLARLKPKLFLLITY